MNFLAHAYIAGPSAMDRIGGLMGDFVKGFLPAGLPPALASGVALHRAIDSFADRHAAFAASRARISPARRRVSGILTDMFYDHLLARDWEKNGLGSLEDFTTRLYAELQAHGTFFAERARGIARQMHRDDWLGSYRNVEALGQAIDRMSAHRLRIPNTLAGGIEEFLMDAEGFEADFRAFLPDVLVFSADWRAARDA